MDWVSLFMGVALGGVLSWLITWNYSRKALNHQKQLRQEDEERRDLERADEYARKTYESERSALYRNRESNYNEHRANVDRRWDLTVNSDNTVTLKNLRNEIPQFFEIQLENPEERWRQEVFLRHDFMKKGGSITFPLPHGIYEVDGLYIQTYAGSSYPEQETVSIHPKHTMHEYQDPRKREII